LTLVHSQLALKHRQNKAQRQRIIVFVCSPVEEGEVELIKLAKRMKKSGVSVDFVLFGDIEDENEKKLQSFNEAVKGSEGSHFEIITPGPQLLSDRLISTPILLGDSAQGGPEPSGGGPSADMPFDPAEDPELALALRMSLEEENARQERVRREEAAAASKTPLDAVKEEGESEPLLNNNGEPSESGGSKKDGDKPGDDDKMDTS
jgi:26S proteasome regulatory subunit N10